MSFKNKSDSDRDLPSEHVTMFSDEWYEDGGQRHRGDIKFGIILILAGTILVLNNSGVIPWAFWDHVWKFWPVLFIIWGIEAVLSFSRLTKLLGSLISLAIIILIFMFAAHEVNPGLVGFLPPELNQVFNFMKGLQK
jgi:hypothetical protein